MRTVSFYQQLLGLQRPWQVDRVRVSSEEKKKIVVVEIIHRQGVRFPCSECGIDLPVYDHVGSRSWRHLDSGSYLTFLEARIPRVACLFHGVHQVEVPWALLHARFTIAFERWAIDVLQETDVLGATHLLRVSWDEAWHLMERAVERGQRRKERRIIACLGVDEKAIAKGHSYFTVVSDLDRSTVEYVAKDRKTSSLDGFYQSLTTEQLVGIEAVAMDMWDPFVASTMAHVPGAAAKIVFDRYHLMTYLNKAVDEVRKKEHRALRSEGDETLTKTKYLWLYAEENLPERHAEWFAALRALHLKTGRAWALKENLRELWRYQRRGWAERHWKQWYFWATHSRLDPIIKAAHTLQRHLPNMMTYFAHRITNATSEGLNSKIQTLKKTLTDTAARSISRPSSTFTAGDSIFIHLTGNAELLKSLIFRQISRH